MFSLGTACYRAVMGVQARWADPLLRALALGFALIAIALQANAPIQAAMMAANADVGANICSVHNQGSDQDRRTPAERQAACAACSVCIGGGFAILADSGALLKTVALWGFAHNALFRGLSPRGPPLLHPNARAPPIFA